MNLGSIYYLLYIYIFFFQLSFLPALFNTRHRYMASQLLFSHVINLLSTKFGQDCTIKTTDWNFPRIAFNRGDTVHVQYMSAAYVQRFWVNELSCYQLQLQWQFCCLCKTTEHFFSLRNYLDYINFCSCG